MTLLALCIILYHLFMLKSIKILKNLVQVDQVFQNSQISKLLNLIRKQLRNFTTRVDIKISKFSILCFSALGFGFACFGLFTTSHKICWDLLGLMTGDTESLPIKFGFWCLDI
ncbi:MAG TPA: hypothetical protein DEF48_23645 [Nostoc sp. UBA8866]|nr:hypothetical protein [Nostoc sp. UBA8866]